MSSSSSTGRKLGPQDATGFSLVEVLIAVLVLSVGLLSLAQLHGTLVQDGSIAKARTIALYLAQEKLEDLRGFETLRPRSGAQAYADIDDNSGGTIAADTSTSDNLTVYSGVDYRREWTVDEYCFNGPNAAPVSCSPSSANISDLKTVSVTVTWIDADGNSHTLEVSTVIAASDPRQAPPFSAAF